MSDVTGGFASKTVQPQELFDEHLAERGLDEHDISKMGLTFVEDTTDILGWNAGPSIRIPFPGTDECSLRVLNPKRKANGKTSPKYQRRKGCPQLLYIPHQTLALEAVRKDMRVKLVVTEGEFKAYAIAKHLARSTEPTQYFVVGLTGVDNFNSADKVRLMPQLEALCTDGREVLIIYDFDGTSKDGEPKPEVAAAEARFVASIVAAGATAIPLRIGRLAPSKTAKWAVDDYLLKGGSILELLTDTEFKGDVCEPSSLNAALYLYKSQFVIVNGQFYENKTNKLLSPTAQSVQHGEHVYEVSVNNVTVRKPVQKAYQEWPKKFKAPDFGFDPYRQGQMFTGDGKLNTFRNFAHQPVQGDVKPWLEFQAMFFQDDALAVEGEPETPCQKFFNDWVANIVQYPWQRNSTCIQFPSPKEGVGKSFICETIASMLGVDDDRDCALIGGPNDLFGTFNGEMQGKILAVINEPSSDHADHSAKLKDLVTAPKIKINNKYGVQYSQPNYINYMLTTNRSSVVQMAADSRRDFVYSPQTIERAEMRALVHKVKRWFKDEQGYEKLMHFYMSRDIKEFDPAGEALQTTDKEDAAEASRTLPQRVASRIWDWVVSDCDGRVVMSITQFERIVQAFDAVKRLPNYAEKNIRERLDLLAASKFSFTHSLKIDKKSVKVAVLRKKHVSAMNPSALEFRNSSRITENFIAEIVANGGMRSEKF
jgi:hypothetical protein